MRTAMCLLTLLTLSVIATAQSTDTNFSIGPQYLITTNQTLFLRPIATPSLSLQPPSPPPPAMETNPGTDVELASPAPAILTQPDLSRILWGNEWVDYVTGANKANVIEISDKAIPKLPLSLFDPGVTGMTDAQSLHQQGYGLTLGQVSALSKSRPHATHVYTNADLRHEHQD